MMNRGTGFITLTLAGHLPARVGLPRPVGPLPVAVLGPQPYQVIAEHLLHPPVEVHDHP
jgi:hypothetical protein